MHDTVDPNRLFLISDTQDPKHAELFERCKAVTVDWTVGSVAAILVHEEICSDKGAALAIANAMLSIDNTTPQTNHDTTVAMVESLSQIGLDGLVRQCIRTVFRVIIEEDGDADTLRPLLKAWMADHDADDDLPRDLD